MSTSTHPTSTPINTAILLEEAKQNLTKRIVMVDYDGTIADTAIRKTAANIAYQNAIDNGEDEKTAKRRWWAAWQSDLNVATDQPTWVVDMMRGLASTNQYFIIISSARTERLWDASVKWLTHHDVPYDAMFMRPDGDFRRDAEFKQELFERIFSKLPVENLDLIIDDRQQVVDLWRQLKKDNGYGYQVIQAIDPKNAQF